MSPKKEKIVSLADLGKALGSLPSDPDEKPVSPNGKNNGNGEMKNAEPARPTELPEVPALELPTINRVDYKARAEQRRQARTKEAEGCAAMAQWIKGPLVWLDELLRLEHEDKEAFADAAGKISELRTIIATTGLENTHPPYRRTAWVALLGHEFSKDFSTREEVERALERLVADERIMSCGADAAHRLEVYRKSYAINPASLCEESDYAEVQKTVDGLLARVQEKTKKAYHDRVRELAGKTTISFAEARAGVEGRFHVFVPPEEVVLANGERFWSRSGNILFYSDGEKAWPIEAVGGKNVEAAIQTAKELAVFLPLFMLDWTVPPPSRNMSEEMGRVRCQLWYFLKAYQNNICREAKQIKQVSQCYKDLLARVTVSPAEWLLENAIGVALIVVPRWELRDENGNAIQVVRNLLILVERREDSVIVALEIKADENPLDEKLTSLKNGEHLVTAEKFAGVPYPFGAILRTAYGIVFKTSQVNA